MTGQTGPTSNQLVALPAGFTLHNVAALVRDVAVLMEDIPTILQKHGLSPKQYKSLEANPFFQKLLQDAIQTWHGLANTKDRLALGALVTLEDALPSIGARMSNLREDLSSVVETAKLFADLAGIGPKAAQQGTPPGEKFQIIIDLGGSGTLNIEKTHPTSEVSAPLRAKLEGEGSSALLQHFSEGENTIQPLQTIAERDSVRVPSETLADGDSEADTPFEENSRVETGL